jgi:ribokinase
VRQQRYGRGVCVVGSINIDTSFDVPNIPAPGETVLALQKTVGAGGKGANQAVAAASLGSEVAFVGCVGEDSQGAFVRAALAGRGVDVTNMRTVADATTGGAMILVAPDGENVIVVDPGANRHLDSAYVEAYLCAHDPAVVVAQL